jgi:hypothetical protein
MFGGLEVTPKKMGKMTSLSSLSGIKSKSTDTPESEVKKSEVTEDKQEKTKAKVSKRKKVAEKLVTVNIKIREDQKQWLADTASQVRNNNSSPVPPHSRVYPQHLIGIAIDLLEAADIDWSEVKNIEELRQHLNL